MEMWHHAVDGALGLSYLHLLLALACVVVSALPRTPVLPGLVCAGFYIGALMLDMSLGPPPVEWSYEYHSNYYGKFSIYDTVWLFALIWMRQIWPAYVQIGFIIVSAWVMAYPHQLIHDNYAQIVAALNALFIAALFLNKDISDYHHSRWLW